MPSNLCVVLYHPQNDLNIGSVLRVAANFDIHDLRLVTQRPLDRERIGITATHALNLFKQITTYDSLADAVADCQHVFATTSRSRSANENLHTPTTAADISAHALTKGENVALLFGPEDHGLPNDALDFATAVVTIPTSPDYPSLNLSQAVLLLVWETFQARNRLLCDTTLDPATSTDTVTQAELNKMLELAAESLHKIGFFKYDNDTHIVRALRKVFTRAHLSRRELAIFFGIFAEIRYHATKSCRKEE